MSGNPFDVLSDAFTGLASFVGVKQLTDDIWNGIQDLATDIGEAVGDVINDIMEGLFPPEYIVNVGVTAQNIVSESDYGTVKDRILAKYFTKTPLDRAIKEELTLKTSVNTLKAVIRYAQKEHPYGLPTAKYAALELKNESVKSVIFNQEVGLGRIADTYNGLPTSLPFKVTSNHYGVPDRESLVFGYLYKLFKLDTRDSTIEYKGVRRPYLYNGAFVYKITPYITNKLVYAQSEEHVRSQDWFVEVTIPDPVKGSINISFTVQNANVPHVGFTYVFTSGSYFKLVGFYFEPVLTETKEELLEEFNNYSKDYLTAIYPPVSLVKILGKWIDDPELVEPYTHTNAVLKKQGYSLAPILKELKTLEGSSQIQTAAIVNGVNIASTNKASREYVYRFFLALDSALDKPSVKESLATVYTQNGFIREAHTPRAVFSIEEQTYNYMLSGSVNSFVEVNVELASTYKANEIRLSTYTITEEEVTTSYYTDSEGNTYIQYDEYGNEQLTTYTSITNVLRITKKISDTEIHYIDVSGLKVECIVLINNSSEQGIGNLTFSLDPEVNQVFVPIELNILKSMTTMEQIDVVSLNQQLIIYSGVVTKTYWYTSSSFLNFFQGASIVLAVFTLGKSLQVSAAMSAAAVAMQVGKTILIALITKEILTRIVALDPNNKALQIIAAAAAVYVSYQLSDISSINNITFADKALYLVDAAVTNLNTVQSQIMKERFSDYEKELNSLYAQLDEYDRIYDELFPEESYLGNSMALNNLMETPSTFFMRTLDVDAGFKFLDTDNYLNLDLDRFIQTI